MPRKTKLPNPSVGDPIPSDTAAWHQSLYRDVSAALNITADAGSGLVVYETEGGTGLMLDQTALRVSAIFQTPSGGIAAISGSTPGVASCTMQVFNGTTLINGPAQNVYNWTPTSIGGSIRIVAHRVHGYWFASVTPLGRGTVAGDVATTITARSGTTPGSGTITVRRTEIGAVSGTVTVENWMNQSVAVGAYVVATWNNANSKWVLTTAECP